MSATSVDSTTCMHAQIPCADEASCASTTQCTKRHRSEVVPIDVRASSYAGVGASAYGPLNLIGPCASRTCSDQFTQGERGEGIWSSFSSSKEEWIDFDLGIDSTPVSEIRLYAPFKAAARFPTAAQVFSTTSSNAFGCNTASGRGAQQKNCRLRDCYLCRKVWRPHNRQVTFGQIGYRSFVSLSLSKPFTSRYLRLVLWGTGIQQMNLLAVTFFAHPSQQLSTTTTTTLSAITPILNFKWDLAQSQSLCFAQTIRLVKSPTVQACAAAAYAQSCSYFMFKADPAANDRSAGVNCRCCSKLNPHIPHSSWSIYSLVETGDATTTTTPPPSWDNSQRCSTDIELGKRLLVRGDTEVNSYPDPERAVGCMTACHAERTPGCCQLDYGWSPARCFFFDGSSPVKIAGTSDQWSVAISGENPDPPCADAPLTTLVNTRGERLVCSRLAHLCHNSMFGVHVRVQCRKTCKECNSPCVDSKPSWIRGGFWGVQRSCPEVRDQCDNSVYGELARAQCPKTCGMCSDPPSPCSHSELAAFSRCSMQKSCTDSRSLVSTQCMTCWDDAKAGKKDMNTCWPPGVTTGHCSVLESRLIRWKQFSLVKDLCMSCLARWAQDKDHQLESCFPHTNCFNHKDCGAGYYCARGSAGGSPYQQCDPITRCREAKDAVDGVCPGMCSHTDLASLTKCIYSDECDVDKFAMNGLDAECYGCVYTNQKNRASCFPDYETTVGHCSFKNMTLILINEPDSVDDRCLSCVLRVSLADKTEGRTIRDCLPANTNCASHSDCPAKSYCASGRSSALGKYQRCELLLSCSHLGDAIDGVCPEGES